MNWSQEAIDATRPSGMDLFMGKLGGLGGLGGLDFGNVDMKSPLANLAMGMLQQQLSPQASQMPMPQHNMGLQPQQQMGALMPDPVQLAPLGRLYG